METLTDEGERLLSPMHRGRHATAGAGHTPNPASLIGTRPQWSLNHQSKIHSEISHDKVTYHSTKEAERGQSGREVGDLGPVAHYAIQQVTLEDRSLPSNRSMFLYVTLPTQEALLTACMSTYPRPEEQSETQHRLRAGQDIPCYQLEVTASRA